MNSFIKITTLSAAFALAACGSDDNSQTAEKAEDAAPAAAEEAAPAAAAEEESMMEKAEGMAGHAMEKASEMMEGHTLDTSSLDSFKSSLAEMKGSLSEDQSSQLTSALTSLAKGAAEEKGGLMGAAKDMASGKSMEETLYEKMGDQLDGMTFDDILKLAG